MGYSRPLSDTREKKKPCTQLQDSSSFIMEAEAGCQDVKRAKGSSHKWESLFVWIGAWASSFWCLVRNPLQMHVTHAFMYEVFHYVTGYVKYVISCRHWVIFIFKGFEEVRKGT